MWLIHSKNLKSLNDLLWYVINHNIPTELLAELSTSIVILSCRASVGSLGDLSYETSERGVTKFFALLAV